MRVFEDNFCYFSIKVHVYVVGHGDSYEYPQHMFLWRTTENCLLIVTKDPPYYRNAA